MIETLELRPYQRETKHALYGSTARGGRRLAAVVPTGGGKTVIFADIAKDCVTAGGVVLLLAHRIELIDQAADEFKGASAGMSVGVVQGARKEYDADVICASVQTAVRPAALAALRAAGVRLIIIDECHHAVADSYMTILRELGAFQPDGPLVYGFSATLDRADGLALGDVFDEIAHVVGMEELIERGWLLRPVGIKCKVDGLDFRQVRKSRSESGLDDHAVAALMSESLAPAAIVRSYLEHGAGRKAVAFMPSVDLSKEQAQAFRDAGVSAIHIDADTPKRVRAGLVRKIKAGEYDVTCNVGLFTEGTNVPIWSCVILGRPTSSATLFAQMVGRGGRPYPGQRDFLVIDVVGVTGRHRLRTLADLEGAARVEPLDPELAAYDDETPADAEQDESGTSGDVVPQGVDGRVVSEMIDLFSASHVAWKRSPRGVWYLPTNVGYVILAPGAEPETYVVQWADGEPVHADPCDIGAAMSWGERAAAASSGFDNSKGARWRRLKPSRSQQWEALSAGVYVEGMTRGELTDALDTYRAARVIDALPAVATVSPAGYWQT